MLHLQMAYCEEGVVCRHQLLLYYLGQTVTVHEACYTKCDVCAQTAGKVVETRDMRQAALELVQV